MEDGHHWERQPSLPLSTPDDFGAAGSQARIVPAKALRWQLDPNGVGAAAHRAAIVDVLSNYAKVTGGTSITSSELVQSYFQAFDFINAGLTTAERASITSRGGGALVLTYIPEPAAFSIVCASGLLLMGRRRLGH